VRERGESIDAFIERKIKEFERGDSGRPSAV
jgi:hypothetical protein